MKLLMPPRLLRVKVVHLVTETYDTDDFESLHEAARLVSEFYHLQKPIRITPRRSMRPRTLAGLCIEDARINILRPSVWKAEGRSRDRWIDVVLHEFGHAVLWADAETKADLFASRWRKDAA